MTQYVDVVMSVLPHHDGEFIELEDDQGRGLGPMHGAFWIEDEQGYYRLRIPLSLFSSNVFEDSPA